MLNSSPFNIEYPDELKNKIYVFQVNTSDNKSYRVNPKMGKDLEEMGLSTVPFIAEGVFGAEFFRTLTDKLIAIKREGAVVSMPGENLAWKYKFGAYDTSSYWTRFTEEHENGKAGELIKILSDLARAKAPEKPKVEIVKKSKPKVVSKLDEVVKTLVTKEMGHHDWKGEFVELNAKMEGGDKNEKKKVLNEFFGKFSEAIMAKLEVEDPELVKDKQCKVSVMKQMNAALRG